MSRSTRSGARVLALALLVLGGCQAEPVRAPQAPPAHEVEDERGVSPGPDYFWQTGRWGWLPDSQIYYWLPGDWARLVRGRIFIPGRWEEQTHEGQQVWVWIEPRWARDDE